MNYLGTKISFNASMLPQNYKGDKFDSFKDVKKIEKKRIKIPRAEVISKTSLNTSKNIVKYVNEFFEGKKSTCYGVITFIESNIKGNNTLKDVEPTIDVIVFVYIKQNNISSND